MSLKQRRRGAGRAGEGIGLVIADSPLYPSGDEEYDTNDCLRTELSVDQHPLTTALSRDTSYQFQSMKCGFFFLVLSLLFCFSSTYRSSHSYFINYCTNLFLPTCFRGPYCTVITIPFAHGATTDTFNKRTLCQSGVQVSIMDHPLNQIHALSFYFTCSTVLYSLRPIYSNNPTFAQLSRTCITYTCTLALPFSFHINTSKYRQISKKKNSY